MYDMTCSVALFERIKLLQAKSKSQPSNHLTRREEKKRELSAGIEPAAAALQRLLKLLAQRSAD
jgi:hypothetical protein